MDFNQNKNKFLESCVILIALTIRIIYYNYIYYYNNFLFRYFLLFIIITNHKKINYMNIMNEQISFLAKNLNIIAIQICILLRHETKYNYITYKIS